MWQLKFEHAHQDCLYSPHVKRFDLVMYGYPLTHVLEENKLWLTGLQIVYGTDHGVKKYILALRKTPNIKKIEMVTPNAFFYEAVVTKNIFYYQNIYHQRIFYPSPIIHKHGKEMFEVASWNRSLLEQIMQNVQSNKNTKYFKLLALERVPVKRLFLPQILPKLTEKQRQILRLAQERGYWQYPRRTNLNKLAQELKLAKSTVHEIIKRGEAKLIEFLM